MNLWKGAGTREYTLETDFETLTLWNPYQTREPRAPPLSTVSKKGCTRAMSLLTLYHPMGCSPPGSSVHGILQATILGWVAVPPAGDLPELGIKPASLMFSALAGKFYTARATWEAR